MVIGKKQAPTPTKTTKKSQPKRRQPQRKKFGLSKEGKEFEKRLMELVDADIEEHNKLPAFQIDMFLAKLAKELDPTIELPEEPVKEKEVQAEASLEGEVFQVNVSADEETETTKEIPKIPEKVPAKSESKVECNKSTDDLDEFSSTTEVENASSKVSSEKTTVTEKNQSLQKENEIPEKGEEGSKGKSGKGPASIGELHELIEDIVKTTKNIEKSRKSRIGKSSRGDAPAAS